MRGYIEIDLKTLKANYESVKSRLNGVEVIAVIKADGYGHGAMEIAKILNADGYAVATLQEGVEVRTATKKPVLILGKTDFSEKSEAVARDITFTVTCESDIFEASQIASKIDKIARVNIAVDTGMNRIGVKTESEYKRLIKFASKFKEVAVTGVYSHFFESSSDIICEKQFKKFIEITKSTEGKIKRHISATGRIFDQKYRLDAVRLGIGLYGYGISGVRPSMKVVGKVVRVTLIKAGESVGYGGKFIARKPTYIATVSLGYADGIRRAYSGAKVEINDKEYDLIGNICMDMCFVKVDRNVKEGDEVVFLGGKITATELAKISNTIEYEVLTGFKRLQRIYCK